MTKGIPLQGDRAVWDAEVYPTRHANDIDTEDGIHHTLGDDPLQAAPGTHTHPLSQITDVVASSPTDGDILTYNASQSIWVSTAASALGGQRQFIFNSPGTLSVGANPLIYPNATSYVYIVEKVFLIVGTAPTGADLIVDIHKNGTTIFTTQSNRPVISAGETVGYSATIDDDMWFNDDYLTMEIDQIGSSVAGADLTVAVVYSIFPLSPELGVGLVSLTGNSITVVVEESIVSLNPGVLALSGSVVADAPGEMSLGAGILTLTGPQVTVYLPRIVSLQPGVLTLVGNSILMGSPEPPDGGSMEFWANSYTPLDVVRGVSSYDTFDLWNTDVLHWRSIVQGKEPQVVVVGMSEPDITLNGPSITVSIG